MHPPDKDKHGNDVSLFVEEAIRELRKDSRTELVLCDYFQTGKLQVYSTDSYVYGEVIRLAREMGYKLTHTTTRSELTPDTVDDVSEDVGYAEFVPANNRGHVNYGTNPIKP